MLDLVSKLFPLGTPDFSTFSLSLAARSGLLAWLRQGDRLTIGNQVVVHVGPKLMPSGWAMLACSVTLHHHAGNSRCRPRRPMTKCCSACTRIGSFVELLGGRCLHCKSQP